MYQFSARGHPATRATHKNTIEFTKDLHLTVKGDCILGVGSDFSKAGLKRLVKSKRIMCELSCGTTSDSFTFYPNREFNDEHEVVIRRGTFLSERTYGTRSSKAAQDIDRKLVEAMQKDCQMKVSLRPVGLKAVLFDFDDTLEDWSGSRPRRYDECTRLAAELGLEPGEFIKRFKDIEYRFLTRERSVAKFDRTLWFGAALKSFGIEDGKLARKLCDAYWEAALSCKAMPGAQELIRSLKGKYKLGIISDSDGSRSIKLRRMKHLGLYEDFRAVITGDVIKAVKPDIRLFQLSAKRLGVRPEEILMVGDHPETDLLGAKQVGMATCWIRHGYWSDNTTKNYPYVDFVIERIADVKKVVRLL